MRDGQQRETHKGSHLQRPSIILGEIFGGNFSLPQMVKHNIVLATEIE